MLFTLNDSRVIARIPDVYQKMLGYSTSNNRKDVTTDSFDKIVTPLFTTTFSPNLAMLPSKQLQKLENILETPSLPDIKLVVLNRGWSF